MTEEQKKWKYKIVYIKKDQKQMDICLSDFGEKGWELVNLDSCFQLKEEKKLESAEYLYQFIFKRSY